MHAWLTIVFSVILFLDIKASVPDTNQVLYIPMVIHVVYQNESENISEEQIFSQVEALNRDINLQNDTTQIVSSFRSVAANCQLVFYVTNMDTLGDTTLGITRTLTTVNKFSGTTIFSEASGGVSPWDTANYLNVWVCDLTDAIVGLESNANLGVVVDYRAFGTTGDLLAEYNMGHTLTHEVGHYLGLLHTWSLGSDSCTNTDGISDTPDQSVLSACNVAQESCGTLDMVQNFMNSSTDDCLLFFTEGQKSVMRSNLLMNKSALLTDTMEGRVSFEGKLDNVRENAEYEIYPNPTTSQELTLSYLNEVPHTIYLTDNLGRLIDGFSWFAEQEMIKISIPILKGGLYFLNLQLNNRKETLKLLVDN